MTVLLTVSAARSAALRAREHNSTSKPNAHALKQNYATATQTNSKTPIPKRPLTRPSLEEEKREPRLRDL
jgi:hypothetical protein